MLDAGVVALAALLAVVSAGPLQRIPRESEDYQAMDAYTNFTANEVCFSDNQVFQRGDLVPNPGPCEECRCEPPSIVCNMVRCPVNANGCRTIQRPNQCCPEYICECDYNGRTINDGARIDTPDEPCQVCYCKGGDIMCNSVTCYTRDDCTPVHVPGQCCPKYENCPIRDSNGVGDNNSVSNRSVNHGNNNKDMQPWLLTKTVSQAKTPEPAQVTTETGDVVIVSDWLTEKKLMTEDLSSSAPITRHAVFPGPTGRPGTDGGKAQRDGNGVAVVRTGETIAPEEVIFTRVDMLKDHKDANHVSTISPVIHANVNPSEINESTSLRTSSEEDATQTLSIDFDESTIKPDVDSDTLIEKQTEKYHDGMKNIKEETGNHDELSILSTDEPNLEATTESKLAGIDLIPENEEGYSTDSPSYDSQESTTVYPSTDSILQESKEDVSVTYKNGVIESLNIPAKGAFNKIGEILTIQLLSGLDNSETTETFLDGTITTEDPLDVLETTTTFLVDTQHGQDDSSLLFDKTGVQVYVHGIESTTAHSQSSERVESHTEEFEEPVSKAFDFIKPIKVKQDSLQKENEYTTDYPTTNQEQDDYTHRFSSIDDSESTLKIDEETNKLRPVSAVPEASISNINNNKIILAVSNRSSNGNFTTDGSSTTDSHFQELSTKGFSTHENGDLLIKISHSLSQDEGSGNAPPVIDLNDAVPYLQFGGPVTSEGPVDVIDDFGNSASITDDKFDKLETDTPITSNKLPNISGSTIDKSTTPTVTLYNADSTVTPPGLNTNSDKKSLKFESSREIMSTHIPLTPGDLKAIAEYLINKKIKPASNENDQYSTNTWLKGNLTSEDKISSILSAANVSIGIMNYTEIPKDSSKHVLNQVKVEKYEKDDIFKGNSILGKDNSLVNKTGHLHDKYIESSSKPNERHQTQYLDSKKNIIYSSHPPTKLIKINDSSTNSPTVPYTTINSLKNLISTRGSHPKSTSVATTPSSTEDNDKSAEVANNITLHKGNMTRIESDLKVNITNDSFKEASTQDSPFSLTRFISSFFTEVNLPSRGLQKPLVP